MFCSLTKGIENKIFVTYKVWKVRNHGLAIGCQRRNMRGLAGAQTNKRQSAQNYLLLIVPISTFCLGCWQWRRHLWKTGLIEKIRARSAEDPVEFPINNLSQLDQMEYRRVRIRGTYLFEKQFVIRWRSRLDEAKKGTNNRWEYLRNPSVSEIASCGNDGAQVITPFRIEGTELIIMVNRGWIPAEKIDAELMAGRKRSPLKRELNATVRTPEKPHWLLRNHPEKGIWVYKDFREMARHCAASPILVDAEKVEINESNTQEPIGGQTNIALRNIHFDYMTQWFTLSLATLLFWLSRVF